MENSVNELDASEAWESNSENEYRTLVHMMPNIGFKLISFRDGQWQISFVEGGIADDLGLEPSQLTGKTLEEGFPLDLYEALQPSLEKIISGDSEAVFIYESDLRVFSGKMQVVHRNQGEPIVVVGIISDLTELLLDERRRQALIASGFVVFCTWRGYRNNWCIEQITPNIRRFGYEPEDLASGKFNYTDLIHPEDLERVVADVQKKCQVGTGNFRMEYRLKRPDGVIHWVHDITCEMRNQKGKVIYSDSYIVDISEQKLIGEKLRESEERYSLAVDGSNDGIWDWDIVKNDTYRSARYHEILGFPEKLPANFESAGDHIHPDDKEGAKVALFNHLKGDTPYFMKEYRVLTADGEYKWVFVRGKAIWDNEGKPVRVAGSVTDITDRKHTEEQLKYLSHHDPLTRLYNRGVFEREINKLDNQENNSAIGIIVCDIDGLKLYNDILGHNSGDDIIVAAAGVIAKSVRQEDIAARIGGDEFAVLLSNVDREKVTLVTARISKAIEEFNLQNDEYYLSMSVGWAYCNENTLSVSEIFKEADNNMYVKKRSNTQSFRSHLPGSFQRRLAAAGVISLEYNAALVKLVDAFAHSMGLAFFDKERLKLLAKFHDIGMVAVMPRILLKPKVLNTDEILTMQKHTETGYHIALVIPELQPIAEWIRHHHEWWNGHGYSSGLKGSEIPLECRIFNIAMAFNAMVHDHPYRQALTVEAACQEISNCSGVQFDPVLAEKFCRFTQESKA